MTFLPLIAAQGGMLDMAHKTAEKFGVNWWLFLSQCISFVLVAILLQKFAYKPILEVLETRRQRIAEGLENAARIKTQLAEAQKTSDEILSKASIDAQKMIDDARASAKALGEKQAQVAIAEAEQIVVKARQATLLERDKTMAEFRKEIARLVIDTTAKVAGKVLTAEDQSRLGQEVAREIAA